MGVIDKVYGPHSIEGRLNELESQVKDLVEITGLLVSIIKRITYLSKTGVPTEMYK